MSKSFTLKAVREDKELITQFYTFTFGKHKGKSVEEVVIEDPSYIEWLVEETNHIVDAKLLVKVQHVDDYDLDERWENYM